MELIVNLPFYLGTRLCKILPWKMLSKKHIGEYTERVKYCYVDFKTNTDSFLPKKTGKPKRDMGKIQKP